MKWFLNCFKVYTVYIPTHYYVQSVRNDQGFTTAGVACKKGRIKILQWMVTNIEDVLLELQPKNEKKFNSNLLFISIMFQQPDCCLWFCSEFKRRNFDLDQQNNKQLCAVHIAAKV